MTEFKEGARFVKVGLSGSISVAVNSSTLMNLLLYKAAAEPLFVMEYVDKDLVSLLMEAAII